MFLPRRTSCARLCYPRGSRRPADAPQEERRPRARHSPGHLGEFWGRIGPCRSFLRGSWSVSEQFSGPFWERILRGAQAKIAYWASPRLPRRAFWGLPGQPNVSRAASPLESQGRRISHTRLPKDQRSEVFLRIVRPDLWRMHRSMSEPEFKAKGSAVLRRWEDVGLINATEHVAGNGAKLNLVQYFKEQWIEKVPYWYAGVSPELPLVTTNNAVESTIKTTRKVAGGVPTGGIQLAKFMLARVKSWSDDNWDAFEDRPIDKPLWQRSQKFKSLFNTAKIRKAPPSDGILFCCWERAGDDVKDRPNITPQQVADLLLAPCAAARPRRHETREVCARMDPTNHADANDGAVGGSPIWGHEPCEGCARMDPRNRLPPRLAAAADSERSCRGVMSSRTKISYGMKELGYSVS